MASDYWSDTPPTDDEEKDSYWSEAPAPTLAGEFGKGVLSGIDATQQGLYGLASMAARKAGLKTAEDWANEGIARNEAEMQENAPAVGRLEDIGGVKDAALWAAGGLGQLAPFMAASAATAGLGGVAGGLLSGGGRAALTAAGRATMPALAARAAESAVARGAIAGAGLNSIGFESGNVYADQINQGQEPDAGKALTYGTAAGLLDVLPQSRLIGKILGTAAKGAKPVGVIRDVLTQMGLEGSTEAAQTVLERMGANRLPFSPEGISEAINAGALGALGGGVMGGGARAYQALADRAQRDDELANIAPARQFGEPPPAPPPPVSAVPPETGQILATTPPEPAAIPPTPGPLAEVAAAQATQVPPEAVAPAVEPLVEPDGPTAIQIAMERAREAAAQRLERSGTLGTIAASTVRTGAAEAAQPPAGPDPQAVEEQEAVAAQQQAAAEQQQALADQQQEQIAAAQARADKARAAEEKAAQKAAQATLAGKPVTVTPEQRATYVVALQRNIVKVAQDAEALRPVDPEGAAALDRQASDLAAGQSAIAQPAPEVAAETLGKSQEKANENLGIGQQTTPPASEEAQQEVKRNAFGLPEGYTYAIGKDSKESVPIADLRQGDSATIGGHLLSVERITPNPDGTVQVVARAGWTNARVDIALPGDRLVERRKVVAVAPNQAAQSQTIQPVAGEAAQQEAVAPAAQRYEYPPVFSGENPTEVAAKRLVVDAMNGDVPVDDLVTKLRSTGLPSGTLAAITERLGDRMSASQQRALLSPQPTEPANVIEAPETEQAAPQLEEAPTAGAKPVPPGLAKIQAVRAAREAAASKFGIKQTRHTKTGETLHVVTMPTRVERDEYNRLNAAAKALGGYYSTYTKGFTFKDEAAARKFMGADEATTPAVPEAATTNAEPRPQRTTPVGSAGLRADAEVRKLGLTEAGRKQAFVDAGMTEAEAGRLSLMAGRYLTDEQRGILTKAAAKPTDTKGGWRPIGVNKFGIALFENDRGVRSTVENGIRSTEFKLNPNVPHQVAFRTTEEIGAAQPDARPVTPQAPAMPGTAPLGASPKWQPIGKNDQGTEVYQDARGVRSIVIDGVRLSEPVRMAPTRAGIALGVSHEGRFLTADEAKAEAKPEPAATFANGAIVNARPDRTIDRATVVGTKFETMRGFDEPAEMVTVRLDDGRELKLLANLLKPGEAKAEAKPAEVKAADVGSMSADDFEALVNEVVAEKKAARPQMRIVPVKSGTAKGQVRATVIDGPHAGVVGYGNDWEQARAEADRVIAQREAAEKASTAEAPAPTAESQGFTVGGFINKAPTKTAGTIAGEAADHAKAGVKAGFAGLDALFGRKGTLGSGPAFDEETWQKAKPHFNAAFDEFVAAGKSLKEFVRYVIDAYNEGIRPYLTRWFQEKAQEASNAESENVVQPRSPDRDRTGALEGVPSDEVRDLPGGRDARAELEGGGESYVAGNGGRPFGGVQPSGSLGHGEPVLHPAEAGAAPGEPVPQARNFVITDDLGIGKGGVVAKYNDNVAAIKLLKQIESESRQATPAEQQILARYVGWGGIKQVFPKPGSPAPKGWEARAAEIADLLTAEEHEAAARSIQDAHFTSMDVVDAEWSIARRLGFDGGKVLENSMGSGNFFGRMPLDLRQNSALTGIELDSITARLAKQLYPEANIMGPIGFHEVTLGDETFNLNVGNPPFGNQPLYDPTAKHLKGWSIHNFFFGKAIDKLAPGGLHVQVVSRYLMDAKDTTARAYLAHRTELVGAIRLPWTTFKENANTEVVTDIIILKKLPRAEWGTADRSWVETTEIPDPTGKEPMTVNSYFAENPEMIVGTMDRSGEMLHENDITVQPNEGETLAEGINRAINNLPYGIYERGKTDAQVKDETLEAVEAAGEYDVGSYFMDGDRLMRRAATPDGSIKAEPITAETQWSEKQAWGESRIARLRGMIGIRQAVRDLLQAEANDRPGLDQLRATLNARYDAFVAEHGYLNAQSNEQVFRSDPDAPLLLALEDKYDRGVSKSRAKTLGVPERAPSAEKMPIFRQRVVMAHDVPTHVENVRDAVTVSLHERGIIVVPYISDLTGKSPDEVIQELTGGEQPIAYMDPADQRLVLAAEYLSGNVKKKYGEALAAGLTKNADALKAAFPPDLKAGDIRPRLGAPWIDGEAYADFARHLFGPATEAQITYLPATGGFAVRITGGDPTLKEIRWGVQKVQAIDPRTEQTREIVDGRDGDDILARTLNSRELTVWHTDSEGNRYSHPEVTQALAERAAEMNQEFENFVFADLERRERLVNFYNDNYNTNVDPKIDGSYLTLPGKVPDAVIAFRRSQKDGVARIIRYQKVLLDHAVGAGKTFTAIAGAMEQRRLGLKKKPMIVVPNHLVKQWATAFYQLYPGAKILAMKKTDFAKINRKRMLARIATGDYDAVIFSHSSFGFIQNNPDLVADHISRQIEEIQAAMDAARETEGKKSKTAAQYQKTKERLQQRLRAIADAPKDNLLTFQELGVDMLYVDESQEFKNLFFTTGKRGVGGFGNPTGSKRAFDMFIKTKWLQDANAGNGVVFMTGTPISNSLTELYTLQRYLGLNALESRGLRSLDAWLNTFGVIESEYEANVTGTKYKRKERLRAITNAPEAVHMYKEFADSISMEDIKRNFAEDNNGADFPIPKVKGGKPRQNITVEASPAQQAFSEGLQFRMEHLTGDMKKDNALSILGDGRKAALDMRLVDRTQPDNPDGKTHKAADEIARIYTANTDRLGTQLVFLDLSTPIKHGKKDALAFLTKARELLKDDRAAPFGNLSTQWKNLRLMLRERMETVDETAESEKEDEEGGQIAKIEEFLAQSDDIEAAVATADSGFSVYDDLRQKLIDRGIPAKEIAFIHDYNTENQKQDLFDQVNAGQIRVLMGSTSKMGAGTNVQRKAVALHHLDVPWRPSDIEQREGRVVRQGNEFRQADPNFEVEILAYATIGTSDVFFWQTQEQKLNAINSLRNFKGDREIAEVSADAMSAAEMKALASGNPLILEDVKLTDLVRKLEAAQRRFVSNQQDLESQVAKYKRQIAGLPPIIEEQTAVVEKVKAYKADPFAGKAPTVDVDGKPMTATEAREYVRAAENKAEAVAYEKNKPIRDKQAEIERAVRKLEGDWLQAHPTASTRSVQTVNNLMEKHVPEWSKLRAEWERLEKTQERPQWGVTVGGKLYHSTDGATKAIVRAAGDVDPFRAVLGGTEYIRRADAAEYIDPIVKGMEQRGDGRTDLGTIGDIPITLDWTMTRYGRGVEVSLGETIKQFVEDKPQGKFQSADPVSGERVVKAINYMVGEAENYLKDNQRNLQQAKDGLGPVEAQVGKAWGKEDELAAKRARLTEVRSLLAAKPAAKEQEVAEEYAAPEAITDEQLDAIYFRNQGRDGAVGIVTNAKAVEIPGFEDFKFYAYKDTRDRWWVNEATTGMSVNAYETDTRKAAIEEARERLQRVGADKLRASLAGKEITREAKIDALEKAEPDLNVFDDLSTIPLSTAAEVRGAIKALTARWKNAPEIVVVQSVGKLPFSGSKNIANASSKGGKVRGAFWNGRVYLVADNIKNAEVAQFVVLHETVGHYGLKGVLGDSLKPTMERIYATNAAVRALADAKIAKLGYDKALATEEALSDMAGRGEIKALKGWQALFMQIRAALRKIGFTLKFSDNDIADLLGRSKAYVEGAESIGPASPAVDGSAKYSLDDSTPERAAATIHGPAFASVRNTFDDLVRSDRVLNRVISKFNTPYHLAQTKPAFAPVYREAQAFQYDLSRIAKEAADLAPDILPTIEKFADFRKSSPSNADTEATMAATMAGTLWGGGNPLEGRLWTDEELRSGMAEVGDTEIEAFKPLTDKQIGLYRQAMASVAHSLNESGKAIVFRLAQLQGLRADSGDSLDVMVGKLKDLMDARVEDEKFRLAQREEARKERLAAAAPELRSTLKEELAKASAKDKAAAEAQIAEWEKFKQSVADIQAKTEGLIAHGYFPAMRFGEYAVNVAEVDEETGKQTEVAFFRFDTQMAANAAKRAIEAEYGGPGMVITSGVMNTEAHKLFQGLNLDALQVFAKHLVDDEGNPVNQDPLMQEFFRIATSERSSLKRHIHRKGVLGYSTDLQRALAQFTTTSATSASQKYHAGTMLEAAKAIRAGDLQKYATKYVRYLQDPTEEAQGLRGFMANYYILGSLAFGAVNMTQPILVTAPFLSSKTTWTHAMAELGKAAKDVVAGRANLNAEEKAAFQRATLAGTIAPQEIHQLRAESNAHLIGDSRIWNKADSVARSYGITLPSRLLLRKAAFLWGSIYSMTEQFNRGTTFLAAYRIAKEKGLRDPYAFAIDAVESTQFTYNRANRPEVSRGPIGSVVMTFKTFSISYLELAKRLYKTDKKAFAVMMLTLAALAGTSGLPFADDIEDLLDTIGQWLGYGTNSKKALRKFAVETLGEDIANVMQYGISGIPGVPIDVANRLGMHNIIPGSSLFKTSEPNKTRDILDLLGPAATIFRNAGQAVEGLATGQPRQLRGLLPLALQNVAQGAQMADTGAYRDTLGRKVMDVDLIDSAFKTLGFQPNKVAQESRIIQQNQQDVSLQRVMESTIAAKWAQGVVEQDRDKIRAAIAQMRDWNQTNPELRVVITPAQIASRVKQMRLTREQRFTRTAPPEMRGAIAQDIRQ